MASDTISAKAYKRLEGIAKSSANVGQGGKRRNDAVDVSREVIVPAAKSGMQSW
jgi:hypothetical protein